MPRLTKGKLTAKSAEKKMAPLPDWSPSQPAWSSESFQLFLDGSLSEPKKISLEELIEKSDEFPINFPTETVRCKTIQNHTTKEILERNINSAYPVIHESALELCAKFLTFKKANGGTVEKNLYESMNLKQFIDRLLTKRAVMFMGRFDQYMLISGKKGSRKWETVGTPCEKPPLDLENVLSYDEMKVSVFLSVSSYTYFVNMGDRMNISKFYEDRSKIQDEGVIIGCIGTRLKKDEVMEYQEIVINETQNTEINGYDPDATDSIHTLFSNFYGEKPLTYKEVSDATDPQFKQRFKTFRDNCFFDNHLFYKRLTITFDTLLVEANFRAKNAKTTAYIHVVGLGLGVWRISAHQEDLYMDAFYQRIVKIGKNLDAISDICFSYMKCDNVGGYKNGQIIPIEGHPLGGIKIHIFKREPHVKLTGDDEGKLSYVTYAWDGNALPGNEFWKGDLGSSGDSAAASSTQISELHNPHINPILTADGLRVVTVDQQVVDFDKYREMVRCRKGKRDNEG